METPRCQMVPNSGFSLKKPIGAVMARYEPSSLVTSE